MLLTTRNQEFMPSLFNELMNWNNWNKDLMAEERRAMPKMNVIESDTDYQLELCVPGLKKEDLSLSVDTDNNLVIEMVQKEEKKEATDASRRYLRHEFDTLQFKQLLSLPDNVKKSLITAKVEHGVLHVTLPKVTEEEKRQQAQTITIQ
ncbi:MAG: Hsp20/alpha crystallin family protein [Bacteroidales bacterium]|nr:Hsp20/alpha crystallin family protein [Bacteroidales bacterium]